MLETELPTKLTATGEPLNFNFSKIIKILKCY